MLITENHVSPTNYIPFAQVHYARVSRPSCLQRGGRVRLVVARDFWGRNRQRAFFYVRVFNPFSRSYFCSQLTPDVTSFMNVKKDGHMMSMLERLRELAFHHWCLQLLVAWGPLLQQFLDSLLQCWLRGAALITANAYSGCDVGFDFHC